jgi:hypothetical protein
LVAELEEADLALVSEDPRLIVVTLAFQWAKETVESRPVNQGIVVEVEKQILDSCRRRLLNFSAWMRIDHYPVEVYGG